MLELEKKLWQALAEVEDPEIPVSLVDMGLIVSVAYARRPCLGCRLGVPAIRADALEVAAAGAAAVLAQQQL